MSYYFAKTLPLPSAAAIDKVTEALKAEGFGILSTIDVKTTLKTKIAVDFRPYTILGACNPGLAHEALTAEDRIGVMLPCNVIVQERDDGTSEVAAVDPVASMQAVENPALEPIASEVRGKLQAIIAGL